MSTSDVTRTGSGEVFRTTMPNDTVPPGSGIEVGLAVLRTVMVGFTSAMRTSSRATLTAWLPSSSDSSASTKSVSTSPALPVTASTKLQV